MHRVLITPSARLDLLDIWYLIVYRPDTNPVQIIRVVSGYRDLGRVQL